MEKTQNNCCVYRLKKLFPGLQKHWFLAANPLLISQITWRWFGRIIKICSFAIKNLDKISRHLKQWNQFLQKRYKKFRWSRGDFFLFSINVEAGKANSKRKTPQTTQASYRDAEAIYFSFFLDFTVTTAPDPVWNGNHHLKDLLIQLRGERRKCRTFFIHVRRRFWKKCPTWRGKK